MTELDARSPWVIDTLAMGRGPGKSRKLQRKIPLDSPLGLDMIAIPAGETVSADLLLESVLEGVLVTGTVSAQAQGECGRCLKPLTDTLNVEICELYVYPDSVTDETADADEVFRLEGDLLNLEPAARDALVLAMPLTPHCREDCRGLCPECGERLDDLPPDHAHDRVDPRWAALQQLLESSPESASERKDES